MKYFLLYILFISCSLNLKAQKNWTLKNCIDYALENNLSIKNQALSAEISRIEYNQSKAKLIPTLNASVNSGWNYSRSLDLKNNYIDRNSLTGSLGVNSTLSIFNGLSNLNTIAQRSLELQAATYDVSYRKDQITLSITSAYLKILLDNELIVSYQLQLNLSEEYQKKLEYKDKVGNVLKETLLENKAQIAHEKAKLIEQINNKKYDLLVLAQSIDYPMPDSFTIVQPEITSIRAETSLLSAQEIFDKSSENRPELKAAKLRIKSANKQLNAIVGDLFPALSLNASYNNNYSDAYNISFSKQFNNNHREYLGFGLQIPLLNRLQTAAQIKQLSIQVKKSEFEFEMQKKTYRESIQKAYTNAKASFEGYQANKEALGSEEEAFKYAQYRFDLGLISAFDFNELKNKIAQTRSECLQSFFQFVFATKILDFYMGATIEL